VETSIAATSDTQSDAGVMSGHRRASARGLSLLLADTYTLYLKTHNYHWNVTGPNFASLHLLFEQQYSELALAVDAIAERIRALGAPAPGSYKQFAELARVADEAELPDSMEMVRRLLRDHDTLLETAREALDAAEEHHDQPSADLVSERMQVHQKAAWMLRATLG
jgi:starvation-inducible DNA-binding protein